MKPINNVVYQIQYLTKQQILKLQKNIYNKSRKPITCRQASLADMYCVLCT